MECNVHGRPYEYICKAQACDLSILCSQCRKSHLMQSKIQRNVHSAQIIQLNRAYEQADKNLQTNLKCLKSMTTPIQNQQQIAQKIQTQKRLLLQERDDLIRRITEVFNKEIADLEGMNKASMTQNKQVLPIEELQTRINKIQDLQQQYRNNPNKLRQALLHSQQNYLNQLSRNNSAFSSMKIQINEYFIYDEIKHDFFLSRLQLKKKTLNNKLLQKVYNESDKYFLIDDYKQGKYLHFFSPTENILRIYDIETQKWKQFTPPKDMPIPSYGATLYDNRSNRFYLIGGQIKGNKTNTILWYSMTQGWKYSQMSRARSSAMITSLQDKSGNTYILIAGGVGDDRKHMKHCQIYNPNFNTCFTTSPMNFAVTSGALVTFNGSVAFRIGGLGEFKQNMASICQIPEKCNFTKFLEAVTKPNSQANPNLPSDSQNPKWTYMDIEVINSEITKKFNLFYAHQAAIQINPNQIFIFGGMTHNSVGVTQTYILQIQSIKNKSSKQSFRYYARWINQKPLISAEGFINLRPIIYDKKVMSLQNISCGPTEYYQKQKRLIQFNMHEWRQIQNVVQI